MTDTSNADLLGIQPDNEFFEPSPPDAQALFDQHRKNLAQYNDLDPASICFRRPDLAAKMRADAEQSFQAFCIRGGITPPVPDTPQTIAARQFKHQWRLADMSPEVVKELDEHITKAELAPKADQEKAVSAMVRQLGSTHMSARAPAAIPSTRDGQEAYIASAGAAEHAELIR